MKFPPPSQFNPISLTNPITFPTTLVTISDHFRAIHPPSSRHLPARCRIVPARSRVLSPPASRGHSPCLLSSILSFSLPPRRGSGHRGLFPRGPPRTPPGPDCRRLRDDLGEHPRGHLDYPPIRFEP